MSIMLEFPPDVETLLNRRAAGEGLDLAELVRQIVEDDLYRKQIESLKTAEGHWDYKRLRALPKSEQKRILERAAKEAAPLYEADLALPPHERELTAFEVLNEYDRIYDSPSDYLLPNREEGHNGSNG